MEPKKIIEKFLNHIKKPHKPNLLKLKSYLYSLSQLSLSQSEAEYLVEAILKYFNMVINLAGSRNYREQIKICQEWLDVFQEVLKGDVLKTFVQNATQRVFDIIIEEGIDSSWCVKRELLKIFLLHAQKAPMNVRNATVATFPEFYLFKIIDSVGTYGDYDFQVTLIEAVFRFYPKHIFKSKLKDIIPESEQLSESFASITSEGFDEDVRKFLTAFNETAGKVFSIICSSVFLGDCRCAEPILDLGGLWVDFNMSENAVSWYTRKDCLTDNETESTWHLLSFFATDVESLQVHRPTGSSEAVIYFKLKVPCLSLYDDIDSVKSADNVKFVVPNRSSKTTTLFSKVLPGIFKHKFKHNTPKVSTSRKTVYKPLSIHISRRSRSDSSKTKSDVSYFTGFLESGGSKSVCSVISISDSETETQYETAQISPLQISNKSSINIINGNKASKGKSYLDRDELLFNLSVEEELPKVPNQICILSGNSSKFQYSQNSAASSTPIRRLDSSRFELDDEVFASAEVKSVGAVYTPVDSKCSVYKKMQKAIRTPVDSKCSVSEKMPEAVRTPADSKCSVSEKMPVHCNEDVKCSEFKNISSATNSENQFETARENLQEFSNKVSQNSEFNQMSNILGKKPDEVVQSVRTPLEELDLVDILAHHSPNIVKSVGNLGENKENFENVKKLPDLTNGEEKAEAEGRQELSGKSTKGQVFAPVEDLGIKESKKQLKDKSSDVKKSVPTSYKSKEKVQKKKMKEAKVVKNKTKKSKQKFHKKDVKVNVCTIEPNKVNVNIPAWNGDERCSNVSEESEVGCKRRRAIKLLSETSVEEELVIHEVPVSESSSAVVEAQAKTISPKPLRDAKKNEGASCEEKAKKNVEKKDGATIPADFKKQNLIIVSQNGYEHSSEEFYPNLNCKNAKVLSESEKVAVQEEKRWEENESINEVAYFEAKKVTPKPRGDAKKNKDTSCKAKAKKNVAKKDGAIIPADSKKENVKIVRQNGDERVFKPSEEFDLNLKHRSAKDLSTYEQMAVHEEKCLEENDRPKNEVVDFEPKIVTPKSRIDATKNKGTPFEAKGKKNVERKDGAIIPAHLKNDLNITTENGGERFCAPSEEFDFDLNLKRRNAEVLSESEKVATQEEKRCEENNESKNEVVDLEAKSVIPKLRGDAKKSKDAPRKAKAKKNVEMEDGAIIPADSNKNDLNIATENGGDRLCAPSEEFDFDLNLKRRNAKVLSESEKVAVQEEQRWEENNESRNEVVDLEAKTITPKPRTNAKKNKRTPCEAKAMKNVGKKDGAIIPVDSKTENLNIVTQNGGEHLCNPSEEFDFNLKRRSVKALSESEKVAVEEEKRWEENNESRNEVVDLEAKTITPKPRTNAKKNKRTPREAKAKQNVGKKDGANTSADSKKKNLKIVTQNGDERVCDPSEEFNLNLKRRSVKALSEYEQVTVHEDKYLEENNEYKNGIVGFEAKSVTPKPRRDGKKSKGTPSEAKAMKSVEKKDGAIIPADANKENLKIVTQNRDERVCDPFEEFHLSLKRKSVKVLSEYEEVTVHEEERLEENNESKNEVVDSEAKTAAPKPREKTTMNDVTQHRKEEKKIVKSKDDTVVTDHSNNKNIKIATQHEAECLSNTSEKSEIGFKRKRNVKALNESSENGEEVIDESDESKNEAVVVEATHIVSKSQMGDFKPRKQKLKNNASTNTSVTEIQVAAQLNTCDGVANATKELKELEQSKHEERQNGYDDILDLDEQSLLGCHPQVGTPKATIEVAVPTQELVTIPECVEQRETSQNSIATWKLFGACTIRNNECVTFKFVPPLRNCEQAFAELTRQDSVRVVESAPLYTKRYSQETEAHSCDIREQREFIKALEERGTLEMNAEPVLSVASPVTVVECNERDAAEVSVENVGEIKQLKQGEDNSTLLNQTVSTSFSGRKRRKLYIPGDTSYLESIIHDDVPTKPVVKETVVTTNVQQVETLPEEVVPVKRKVLSNKQTKNKVSKQPKNRGQKFEKSKRLKIVNPHVTLQLDDSHNRSNSLHSTFHEILESFRKEAGTSLSEKLREPPKADHKKTKKWQKRKTERKNESKPKNVHLRDRIIRQGGNLDDSDFSIKLNQRKNSKGSSDPDLPVNEEVIAPVKTVNIVSDITVCPKRTSTDDCELVPRKMIKTEAVPVEDNVATQNICQWLETGSLSYSEVVRNRQIVFRHSYPMYQSLLGPRPDRSEEYQDALNICRILEKYI